MSTPNPATTDWVPLWNVGAQGGFVLLDGAQPAAQRILASKLVSTDAQPAFRIMGDGKHEWGPGGATAPDTNLYRKSANLLATDDDFQIDNASSQSTPILSVRRGAHANGNGIEFGHSNPGGYGSTIGCEAGSGTPFLTFCGEAGTNNSTYRSRGLKPVILRGEINATYARLHLGTLANSNADNQSVTNIAYLGVDNNGKEALYFGANLDTNLYRYAANLLATGGALFVNLGQPVANHVYLGYNGSGLASHILFGNDTNLYRAGANALKTDDELQVVGALYALSDLFISGNAGWCQFTGDKGAGGGFPGSGYDACLNIYVGGVAYKIPVLNGHG